MIKNYCCSLLRSCSRPSSTCFFVFMFILNLISNFVYVHYDDSLFAIVCIIGLSALTAYVESVVYILCKVKIIQKTYSCILAMFHGLLILVEYFLLINFQRVLNQDVIDILGETNPVETANFMETYLSFPMIAIYSLCLLAFLIILYRCVMRFCKPRIGYLGFTVSVVGMCVASLCIYGFIKYRNGMSIPQYTTITRGGYALYLMHGTLHQIDQLANVCEHLQAKQTKKQKPTIVVVIGESYSVYHSSLYGYDKETCPLLKKRLENGEMIVFDNVVSLYDGTHGAMHSIFSLDSMGVNFSTTALFPACFRSAGYKSYMFDNQYFVGSGISFLSDAKLSSMMFDERNKARYQFDGQMIDAIRPAKQSLYVVHLWGQHYTYRDRYPAEYRKFKPSDYDTRYTLSQREIMAHYDNATLYNDYVINKLLDKFENDNCCLFYFSDHGEEVYEQRDYMGHGNAAHAPNLNYQIRVPLMIWMSPSFLHDNTELVASFKSAQHYPICTDDISHTLLEVAGIECKGKVSERSFIHPKYNTNKHRIVLNSVDYDGGWINRK